MATQGKYAVIDTTLTKTDSTLIDSLSGRQGDNGRIVYFAIKDGRTPHNLDGQNISLQIKDAAGKVKVIYGVYDMISATGGLFSMFIPSEVYQAAGDVQEAYLVIENNLGTSISSVPITFTVFSNGIILSANASRDYLNTVQEFVDDFNSRIKIVDNNLNSVKSAYDSLNYALENFTKLINDNSVSLLNGNNEFTNSNVFDKDILVKGSIRGNLSGKSDSSTFADTANISNTTSIPYLSRVDIDLNILPTDKTKSRYYSAFYFSGATSVANTPDGLTFGLVENFVLTSSTIIQRFTRTASTDMKIWTRLISAWQSDTPNYQNWISDRGVRVSSSISFLGGDMYFQRSGNTVQVYMNSLNNKTQFPAYTKIADANTIPAGFRPLKEMLVPLEQDDTQSGRINGNLMFYNNGQISSRKVCNSGTEESSVTFTGTWITGDDMPA